MSTSKRRWSEKDLEFLRANYPTMPLEKLSLKLGRGLEGIKTAAQIHGIKRPKNKGPLLDWRGKKRYRVLRNGCWQWIGRVNAKGYPTMKGADTSLAHRQVYIDKHGPIPADHDVDHLCRYRRCVNVEHLESVTHQVNVQRGLRAKLTVADAERIRADKTSSVSQLAREYGVWPGTISCVRSGITWNN